MQIDFGPAAPPPPAPALQIDFGPSPAAAPAERPPAPEPAPAAAELSLAPSTTEPAARSLAPAIAAPAELSLAPDITEPAELSLAPAAADPAPIARKAPPSEPAAPAPTEAAPPAFAATEPGSRPGFEPTHAHEPATPHTPAAPAPAPRVDGRRAKAAESKTPRQLMDTVFETLGSLPAETATRDYIPRPYGALLRSTLKSHGWDDDSFALSVVLALSKVLGWPEDADSESADVLEDMGIDTRVLDYLSAAFKRATWQQWAFDMPASTAPRRNG